MSLFIIVAGTRLCASKVKPVTQVQIRRVSELNPVNNDLRKRYLKGKLLYVWINLCVFMCACVRYVSKRI